jgi:hypothetical protein
VLNGQAAPTPTDSIEFKGAIAAGGVGEFASYLRDPDR